ncbi:diaminopimelate epimerase [Emcibacter nanhaiensis]|uniref:Diaminopimelate epimerase n=2 Tax=Emcibacter nanhaiensis TaxID=1505037 RepID=A0A501PPM2_9PROT|nr:diaminopimelate epimerase [Emcibacter nanhaiensis]
MHGLGNDFVIFDGREDRFDLSPDGARFVADRHRGVGCDQVITLWPSNVGDVFMRIQNADGSEVGACGNATRCVAHMMLQEFGADKITIETLAGLLHAERNGQQVRVDMGEPRLDWDQIPLAREMDTESVELVVGGLGNPVAVNMGNPHAIFFVDSVDGIDLEELGPQIETHELFPERANVSIVEKRGPGDLRLRVWERGAGITQACGSAACAAVVAASRRGLVERAAAIELDGGTLVMAWAEDNHVMMTGDVAYVFAGHVFAPFNLEGHDDRERR